MTTPAHRPAHLATAILALGLAGPLGSGCAEGPDPDDDQARMAVVFVTDGGLVMTVGSYDIESGELTFVARAQRDMDTRIGDAGYRAFVADDGELSEVDLAAGVVSVAAQLDEGEELELRVAGDDIGTLVLGRLELRAPVEERMWKLGNKIPPDDWLSPVP